MSPGAAEVADQVAAAVLAHLAVAGLHGGSFGTTATHLPGRRVVGVRLGDAQDAVEVGVVLRLGDPLPDVVEQLRRRVAAVVGDVSVDVVVGAVVAPGEDPGAS